MNIVLHSETSLSLRDFQETGFNVQPGEPGLGFSAPEMLAVSLGLCTASVLIHYAEQIDVDTHDLAVILNWEYSDGPSRISRLEMDVRWPSLPESRLQAVMRAAEQCTVHNTLQHKPLMHTRISREAAPPVVIAHEHDHQHHHEHH